MSKALNYQKELINRLKCPERSPAYLNAASIDGDPRIFLKALKNILEAQSGMSEIAKKSKLNRESMYKTLSGERDPHLSTVMKILDSIGIELKACPKQ